MGKRSRKRAPAAARQVARQVAPRSGLVGERCGVPVENVVCVNTEMVQDAAEALRQSGRFVQWFRSDKYVNDFRMFPADGRYYNFVVDTRGSVPVVKFLRHDLAGGGYSDFEVVGAPGQSGAMAAAAVWEAGQVAAEMAANLALLAPRVNVQQQHQNCEQQQPCELQQQPCE